MSDTPDHADPAHRRTLAICLALNMVMMVVEGGTGAVIGSAALLADAIRFVDAAAVLALALATAGWTARDRANAGLAQAIAMGLVGLAAIGEIADRVVGGGAPTPRPMAVVALAAMTVNFYCASRAASIHGGDTSPRAVWRSIRNTANLNMLTLFAAAVITVNHAGWPDIAAGVAIVAVNLWAVRGVFLSAAAVRRAS